jgi:ribose transport system substrate-binding protein
MKSAVQRRQRRLSWRIAAPVALLALAAAGCSSSASSGSSAATGSGTAGTPGGTSSNASAQGGFKIAYANSELGNTFHQVLVKDAQTTAASAEKQGLVSKFTMSNANNSVATQSQQIRSFIVQHYDAIIVDAASGTGLNGAIQQACSAGILVVAVNETVTAPCAYNVQPHWQEDTAVQMDYFNKVFHGTANILNVHGVAGTLPDAQFQEGIQQVTSKDPGLKMVGTIYGQWTETIAQQQTAQTLPSLPKVDAVVTQGGDESGVINAFRDAKRPLPLIVFGNRGIELQTWTQILKADPSYKTFSISDWPGGIESFGFWTTVALLQKQINIPKAVWFPLEEITQQTLPAWLKGTPTDGVATRDFTYQDSLQILQKEPNIPQVITAGPTGPISFAQS